MSNITNLKIPNDSIITEFKQHLDLEFNQRILFTAPFGAGKSTFINDFEEQHREEYRFVKLYPVNYAVSANEDIFELIKFDILHELLTHYQDEINLELEDFNFWLRMSMFMQNKTDLMPLFLLILSQNEKIGKSAAVFIGALEKVLKPLKKGFKEYSEQIKIDELKDISKFLESFRNQKGTAYEMNATSKFIHDLVSRLKENEINKEEDNETEDVKNKNKTVLVIDDLDRLDPEHIFRLFNIFSAHTHLITGENKFGFDKVIFVCDIENIRKIYAHKYGEGVDFSGYMDKFYSAKPFEFDNEIYLSEKIEDIVKILMVEKRINIQGELIKQNIDNDTRILLIAMWKILVKYQLINLRSLITHNNISFKVDNDIEYKEDLYYSEHYLFIDVFCILKNILGKWTDLEERLAFLAKEESIVDLNRKFRDKFDFKNPNFGNELKILIREIFAVLIAHQKSFNYIRKDLSYNLDDINLMIRFSIEDKTGLIIDSIHSKETDLNVLNNINLHSLLYKVYKKIQEFGFIPNNK